MICIFNQRLSGTTKKFPQSRETLLFLRSLGLLNLCGSHSAHARIININKVIVVIDLNSFLLSLAEKLLSRLLDF